MGSFFGLGGQGNGGKSPSQSLPRVKGVMQVRRKRSSARQGRNPSGTEGYNLPVATRPSTFVTSGPVNTWLRWCCAPVGLVPDHTVIGTRVSTSGPPRPLPSAVRLYASAVVVLHGLASFSAEACAAADAPSTSLAADLIAAAIIAARRPPVATSNPGELAYDDVTSVVCSTHASGRERRGRGATYFSIHLGQTNTPAAHNRPQRPGCVAKGLGKVSCDNIFSKRQRKHAPPTNVN